jgi:hypothetical protein
MTIWKNRQPAGRWRPINKQARHGVSHTLHEMDLAVAKTRELLKAEKEAQRVADSTGAEVITRMRYGHPIVVIRCPICHKEVREPVLSLHLRKHKGTPEQREMARRMSREHDERRAANKLRAIRREPRRRKAR